MESFGVSRNDRWRWALDRNPGWRQKRNVGYALIVGGLTWLVLKRLDRAEAAVDQIIAIGVAFIATFLLIPLGELMWDAARAGGVLRDNELSRLRAAMAVMVDSQQDRALDPFVVAIRVFLDKGHVLRDAYAADPTHKSLLPFVHWISDTRRALAIHGKHYAEFFLSTMEMSKLQDLKERQDEAIDWVDSQLERLETLLKMRPG